MSIAERLLLLHPSVRIFYTYRLELFQILGLSLDNLFFNDNIINYNGEGYIYYILRVTNDYSLNICPVHSKNLIGVYINYENNEYNEYNDNSIFNFYLTSTSMHDKSGKYTIDILTDIDHISEYSNKSLIYTALSSLFTIDKISSIDQENILRWFDSKNMTVKIGEV